MVGPQSFMQFVQHITNTMISEHKGLFYPPHAHKITVLLLASAVNLITICEQWIMSFFNTVTMVFLMSLLYTSVMHSGEGYHVSKN